MATGDNIKNFTAADIERYHKGLLSVNERHALEKAALDDPFLADALEGYAVAGHNAEAHLADLRTRLAEKMEGARVVALPSERKRRPVAWLRVAALVIIIAGAALLGNQFLFTSKDKNALAKNDKSKTGELKSTDTAATVTATTGTTDEVATLTNDQAENKRAPTTTHKVSDAQINSSPKTEDLAVRTEPVSTVTNPAGAITIPPANAGADDKTKDLTKEKTKDVVATVKPDSDRDGIEDKFDKEVTVPQKRNEGVVTTTRRANEATGGYVNQSTTFRGRVIDSNNVGVPFANVTNAQDNNAGTYTDARGNFTLTYPDSVVVVQVRSIGFENRNVQLRNDVPNNQVVLQDDRKSLSEVVISNQKPNTVARNRDANMKLEEPEPADGWENYDAYLTNNMNPPEEIRTKQTVGGQVQVSFEVNKDGEPINIKVEKSLCSKCDKEAIRLIKDGPKWKRSANKKDRTTVTINF